MKKVGHRKNLMKVGAWNEFKYEIRYGKEGKNNKLLSTIKDGFSVRD
jgi:hypothetical protein